MARILLVDDNVDILETTADLLRLQGHDVYTSSSAEGVLDTLRHHPPDLLLQDCQMPGLDVGGLIHSIRAESSLRALPVLLFTASIEADAFWQSLGADGLVRKPFEAESLRHEIQATLDHSAAAH